MAILTVCSSSTFDSLVSLTSLKTLLGTTTTDDDDLMTDILKRMTNAVEDYIGYPLRRQTYYEKIASYGSMVLQVKNTPVQSISRILKDDVLISSTEYELGLPESGHIYRPYGWSWTAGTVTDLVPHAMPGTERKNFSVEYIAGYVESTSTSTDEGMPLALQEAGLEISKAWYKNVGKKIWDGRTQMVARKQVGDLEITYEQKSVGGAFPDKATALLKSYQRLA